MQVGLGSENGNLRSTRLSIGDERGYAHGKIGKKIGTSWPDSESDDDEKSSWHK